MIVKYVPETETTLHMHPDADSLFVFLEGDTALTPQPGSGNGISHISFCYDADEEPSEPPVESEPPAESEPPTGSESPTEPTPAPSGGVQGATGTPTVTLPPTDALAGQAERSVPIATLITVLGLLSGIAALALSRRPATGRR